MLHPARVIIRIGSFAFIVIYLSVIEYLLNIIKNLFLSKKRFLILKNYTVKPF